MHTVEAADEALVAGALVGPEGTLECATALFRDRCRDPEALLSTHQSKIEEVVEGRADQHSISIDGCMLDVSAVLGGDGSRYALLTLPRPELQMNGDHASPMFYEAVAASPAVVWVKDLDGRYLHVNGAYEKHLGAPADRVCGKTEDELGAGESIEGLRGRSNGGGSEPLELEYVIAGRDGRPGLSVLRFALRSADGEPTAVCGVAAPLPRADMAQSECARMLRLERWSRVDEAEAGAELLRAWRVAPANGTAGPAFGEPNEAVAEPIDSSGEQFAALAAELDAALETSVRLGRELAEERRQVVALREASVMAARRAHDLLREVRAERERAGELEEAVTRAEAGLKELEGEREREQRKVETAEAAAAEAVAAEHHKSELLGLELTAAREELSRSQSELAAAAAALTKEQRTVQTLRAELRASEEAAERARRSAADAATAAAQAPARDELEQERRRADQAHAALSEARVRAEQAQAEKQSAVAQVHAELRRTRAEATESAAALRAEKQAVEAVRAELAAVREELEHTQAAYAAKPSPQELEGHRSRADQAEAASQRAHRQATETAAALKAAQEEVRSLRTELGALRAELDRVQRVAAQEHGEALAQALEELERTRSEAVASSTALDAQQSAAEALAAELSAVREELARARQPAVPETDSSLPLADLERERARAEQAERALEEQRREAEEADAALRAELAARAEEIEALRRQAQAEPAVTGPTEPAVTGPTEPAVTQTTESAVTEPFEAAGDAPTWSAASQRALAAGLMEASDWRGILKKAVTVLGRHGGWDAAVGWEQERGGFMRCAAVWVRPDAGLKAFETRTWKHRLGAATLAAAGAGDGPATSCVVDLETAEDVALRAAAGAGMRYAVLVPIGDGTTTVGLLELISASAVTPDDELALSLEAIGLQLGAAAQQLNAVSSPRWHVGKL